MMDSPQRIKDAMKAFYAKNVRYHELIDRHEQTGATYDGMVKELLDRAAPPGRRPRLVDVALGTGYYVRQAPSPAGSTSPFMPADWREARTRYFQYAWGTRKAFRSGTRFSTWRSVSNCSSTLLFPKK